MKVQFHRRRGRAGFTLPEMLTVVGILAILLSVAVPAILHYQRELKLTELDDNARSVFMAAQNHLTALRSASSGELEVSEAAGRKAKEASAASALAGTELLYVSTHDGNTEPGWLVLPGSIESDLAEGSYLVEFEPKSGTVYGVFFMEKGSKVLDEGTYGTVCSSSCRTRAGRKAFSQSPGGFYVGYYGSDGTLDVDRPDAQTLPKPKLKLINAEELVLEIGTDASGWSGSIDQSKVYASVVVSDGSATKTLVSKGAIRSGAGGTVVLDTLKTSGYDQGSVQSAVGWKVGAPFADWMRDGSDYVITPGANVTITVSIWYDADGMVALPQMASVNTNSLFAARSGNAVQLAYGRHLQNLNADTSKLDSAVTAAEQIRAIDFDKAGGGITSWADTYGHDARPFAPIDNDRLDTYKGNSLTIRNLNAKAKDASGNAGLFASFQGSRLENVTLVDAQVNGGSTAGALAGTVENATVSNCHAYFAKRPIPQVRGSSDAGGLIGNAANCTIQDGSYASVYVSGVTVGGLVGRSGGNVTVKESYAAGHLFGTYVGGLVGRGGGTTIQDCYAAGTIAEAVEKAGNSPEAGGLSTSSATVRRSYAAVEYANVPTADKVSGAVPGGSCDHVYYLAQRGVNDAVSVSGVTAVTSSEQMRKDQGLALGASFIEGGDASVMTQPYNLDINGVSRDPQLTAPYPYPTLKVGVAPNQLTVPHYGDWLVATPPSAFLAYFEQYADGSYGYQYPTATGEENTLSNDKGALRNEGYVLISKEDPKTVQIAGTDVSWSKHTDTYTDSSGEELNIYILGTDLIQKRHTQAPARYTNVSDMPADYGGYCELTVDGHTLWFNPDFARTTSLTRPSSVTRENEIIRSIRQLNNMRRYSSDKPDKWTQELDLDGALYEGYQADGTVAGMAVTTAADGSRHMVMDTITMVSSTALKDSWGAEYDGGGHAIRHMDIKPVTGVGAKDSDQKRTYAGLFGRTINASVKDLTVECCDVTGTKLGSGDVYAGALLAYNEGAVENCYAVNCTVTSESGYAGGLLGAARQGTVTNCGVRVNSASDYDRYTVSGGTYVGGFAGYESDGVIEHCYAAVKVSGENAGGFAGRLEGAGSIKNSYAGGHTVNGVYSASTPNVSATKLAGGFAGKRHATKLVAMENVYTTCSVGVPKDKTADVFAPEVDQTPAGFAYAVGDVFVDGAATGQSSHNKAGVKFRPSYPGTKAEAHPYDETLAAQYYYQPISRTDGTSAPHYGDWCENTDTRANRDWQQQLVENKKQDYEQVETNLTMEDGKVHIEYIMDNTGAGWDATRVGPNGDGVFCISTDLNYMLIFRFVNENGEKKVIGGSGAEAFTFAWRYVDKDGNTVPKEVGDADIYSYDKIVWDMYVDPSELPPYVKQIRVGAVEDNYQAILDMPEGGVPPKDLNGTISVEDGSFDDWIGYEHQVYEGFPGTGGGGGTPLYGHWTASILGYENKIYLHVIDENLMDIPQSPSAFPNVSIFSFANVKVTTKDGTEALINDFWQLHSNAERILENGETQTGAVFPTEHGDFSYRWHCKIEDYSSWPPVLVDEYDIMRWFLRVEDGRVEYELEFDLDSIAKKYLTLENGDSITDFQLSFNRGILDNGQLKIFEVKRDPKTE